MVLWNCDCGLFADPYRWGSVLHSLGTGGLIVWHYHTVSLSPMRNVPVIHFLSLRSKHFNMSLEYNMVNDHAKKAALFFLTCKAIMATRFSICASMRANMYLDVKTVDQILAQQVQRESQKIKSKILLVLRQWPWLQQCWPC
jgi:hypothetical protein